MAVSLTIQGTTTGFGIEYVSGSLRVESRRDSAIAKGSLKSYFKYPNTYFDVRFPIPPFSKIQIDGNNYVCYSEVTEYPSTSEYVHDITFLDMVALLEGFEVGTKAFSESITDAEKVKRLIAMMNSKYPSVSFSYESIILTLNKKRTFESSRGETFLDCLESIMNPYGYRPVVTQYTTSPMAIKIGMVTLDSGSEYTLNDRDVLERKMFVNADEYCNRLETEAKNVVDRTTLTKWDYLTVRSKGTRLCVNYAEMKLPSKVEQIVDFGFNDVQLFCDSSSYIELTTISKDEYNSIISKISTHNTFVTIRNYLNTKYAVDIANAYSKCFGLVYTNRTDFYNREWSISQGTNNIILYPDDNLKWIRENETDVERYPTVTRFSFQKGDTPILLEKSQWDALDDNVSYKYPFYTAGGTTIDNMDSYYKYDLWNRILGIGGASFIADINNVAFVKNYSDSNIRAYANVFPYIGDGTNSMYHRFYVDAYTITDPVVVCKKESNEIDTRAFMDISRTYGNSASLIDFDKIVSGMKENNKAYGRIEGYVVVRTDSLSGAPKANQYVMQYGKKFHIASAVTEMSGLMNYTTVANLVQDYNKKAECIGVDNDFESTPLPLKNIIERPVYVKVNGVNSSYSSSRETFIKLLFYNQNMVPVGLAFMRSAKQEADGKVVYTCKMDDQYSAGSYRKTDQGMIEKQLLSDLPYADSNGEAYYMTAQLVQFSRALTLNESYMLPYLASTLTPVACSDAVTITICKDAREVLEVTVEV